MFDPKELKVVLSILTKRRVWLLKTMEDKDLDAGTREENTLAIKLLDSSIQKLSKLASAPPAKPAAKLASSAPPLPRKNSRRPPVEPENAYVLIAEDNHDSAELLRGVLEDMGIRHIEVVSDGRSALYALQNCSPPYDLVLCDWDMPEMSGLEVHRNIRTLAKLRDTHFVMVTAVSENNRIREAIQQGINDYLIKPIDIEILEKKLRVALAGGEAST
jgi:two-component system chemotaxis response regulator CheY